MEHATVSLIPPSVSCSNYNPQDLDTRTFCPQPPLSREDELGWQEHVDGPLDCSQYSTATVLDVDMGSVLNLGRLLEAVPRGKTAAELGYHAVQARCCLRNLSIRSNFKLISVLCDDVQLVT